MVSATAPQLGLPPRHSRLRYHLPFGERECLARTFVACLRLFAAAVDIESWWYRPQKEHIAEATI